MFVYLKKMRKTGQTRPVMGGGGNEIKRANFPAVAKHDRLARALTNFSTHLADFSQVIKFIQPLVYELLSLHFSYFSLRLLHRTGNNNARLHSLGSWQWISSRARERKLYLIQENVFSGHGFSLTLSVFSSSIPLFVYFHHPSEDARPQNFSNNVSLLSPDQPCRHLRMPVRRDSIPLCEHVCLVRVIPGKKRSVESLEE